MSTDIKLIQVQISKIIQSGGYFDSWVGDLKNKNTNKCCFSLKISGKESARAGKGFTLFNSNEVMSDITKVIKSLENLGLWIDGVTETVKHETKKEEGGFLGALLAPSVVKPVISSALKSISARGVRREERGYI